MRGGLLRSILLAALAALPASARADFEETEHRLKSAGVAPALRERVHASIDAAVVYLKKIQRPDGSFPNTRHPIWAAAQEFEGITALCALAARHAGTTDGVAVARKAIDWLVPPGKSAREGAREKVYAAGILLMLLQADNARPEAVRELSARMAASVSRTTGWWGYYLRDPADEEAMKSVESDLHNLSTTQFAALGLWAAGRAGAPAPAEVWRRHLESLVGTQSAEGSWPYALRGLHGEKEPSPYRTGTFMGLANLLLARAALAKDPGTGAELRAKAAAAEDRARRLLEMEGPSLLRDLRRGYPLGQEGFALYDLYALEKAAVFAGLEELGGVPWYASMAEVLVDVQNPDGGWGSLYGGQDESRWHRLSGPVTTAFALLILVRASETYRTETPRPVDSGAGRGVATPGTGEGEGERGGAENPPPDAPPAAPPAPPAPPASPPPPIRLPLADLSDALDLLERRLADPAVPNDAIRRALDFVAAAYVGMREPAEGDSPERLDAWKKEVERVVLAAAFPGPAGPGRLPVRVRAASFPGLGLPRAAPALRRALRPPPQHIADPDHDPELLEAAFRTLADFGRVETLAFLVDQVVAFPAEGIVPRRTGPALRAIARLPSLPGAARREACERLLRLDLRVEETTIPDLSFPVPVDLNLPRNPIEEPFMNALRSLARDPVTGRCPSLPSGAWAGTPTRFRWWMARHRDTGRPPWASP